MNSRKFDPGDLLYRRGDAAASAFELREGRVRLSWPGPGGIEMSSVLGIGQIFGAAELISGRAREATVEALTEVVTSEIGREELARLFADDAEFGKALLRPAFEWLRQEADAARARGAAMAPQPAAVLTLSELRLKPAARELSQQMEADGVRIARMPFRVGRRSSHLGGEEDGFGVELALYDTRPYSLSRRHFAIETHNGGYVVRDCGSHHGTIVNGARIGGELTASVAPLIAGENRIVAGRALSPFRFVLTIASG